LSWETARLQEPLSSIIANQEIIYNYIQESVNSLNKSISELQNAYVSQSSEKNIVDEKQQQKLQLQAQIEALQSEMANL
jgi:archaellum component FlaC